MIGSGGPVLKNPRFKFEKENITGGYTYKIEANVTFNGNEYRIPFLTN